MLAGENEISYQAVLKAINEVGKIGSPLDLNDPGPTQFDRTLNEMRY